MGTILWLGIALATVLRLRYGQMGPAQWDDVDFALALQRYDLAAMQPHFPGYPVYVLAGLCVQGVIGEPYRALAVLSALSSGAGVGLLYLAVRPWFGRGLALAAALLYSGLPLTWVLGTQAMSDAFGALLAIALAAACVQVLQPHSARKKAFWLLAAGTLYGLLLGVRSSYLALGVLPLWVAYEYIRVQRSAWSDVLVAVVASACVCLGWVYAMVINSGGWLPFWQMATSFTEGHFSDWGGTYSADQPFFARLNIWLTRQILGAGFGTPWGTYQESISRWVIALLLLIAGAGILFSAGRKIQKSRQELKQESQQDDYPGILQGEMSAISRNPLFKNLIRDRKVSYLLIWLLPYAIWAFFAQNVEKPRHILPMLAPLCVVVACGLQVWGRRAILAGTTGLVLCMSSIGISTVVEGAHEPAPTVQLAEFLHTQGTNFVVFTYEEERIIHYLYPQIQTLRLRHYEDFKTAVLNHPNTRILLTDSVLQGLGHPEVEALCKPLRSFHGNPWLYPTYHDIILYEADTELINLLNHSR
ncbi:uncharacterized protein DUF2723 [Tumebacillus permanentifrigoris]|uniref:Uncharacterized protein DUF2723 n=1 Tax=Tumebacillus permanentifrigoris TaxID=378543 RepID=A0A316D5H3_9BACL|nr:uncharacterized protein DUF2723 [Tumebacillus permanentifrigoris]